MKCPGKFCAQEYIILKENKFHSLFVFVLLEKQEINKALENVTDVLFNRCPDHS
uniref:Uncharacterized protein n=1 Tax=Nelumbo nucifera TaxID=4432 RepID=A0A822Y1M1_NELNU|nr:TPA_asm: hypothetical protein HUJ06_026429 [Nelumbo nucifera]